MPEIILFNKPFQVLSQFTDRDPPAAGARSTLADYLDAPNFRVAGRLDWDSEGLLVLTDDGVLQQDIANPRARRWKTYLVQVEGTIDDGALAALAAGPRLRDGPCRPCQARRIPPPALWERQPPVRYRVTVPDCWIELAITEGRNRQVRRMTAAVGFPTLRLVRTQVGDWTIDDLAPGQSRRIHIGSGARRSARRRR